MAGEIYPAFPGKGAKQGWYQTDKGSRYYAGGNEFRYSDPQGRTNIGGMIGAIFSPKPLSPEMQAVSDRKRAWLRSDRQGPNPYKKSSEVPAKNSSGLSKMDQRELALKNDERVARIKAESDKVIKAGQDDINSVFYKVPTRDKPAPNGGGGSGTQTSPGGGMPVLDAATAAQFLQKNNIGRGAFSSVQLPGSASNPITGMVPDAFPLTGMETSFTSSTLGAYSNNGVNFAALDNTGINPEQAYTNPELSKAIGSTYQQYGDLSSGGGAFAQQAPGKQKPSASQIKSGRLADELNDTESMRGPETQEGLMRRANAAFLNANTAQEGLRAKEAVLGQFHISGQTYQLGTDDKLIQGQNGKALAMDKDAASSYRLGTSSAQQYKDSYKDKVKEIPAATTPRTPAEAQSPSSINPVPVSKQTINSNLGPMINDEQYGQQLESFKGMRGVGPVINNNVYGEFLEGNREPMMRDTKKK